MYDAFDDAFMTCYEMKYGFKKNGRILKLPVYCGGPCIVLVLDVSVLYVLEYLINCT